MVSPLSEPLISLTRCDRMKRLKTGMLTTVLTLTLLVASGLLFMQQRTFGRNPADARLARIN